MLIFLMLAGGAVIALIVAAVIIEGMDKAADAKLRKWKDKY